MPLTRTERKNGITRRRGVHLILPAIAKDGTIYFGTVYGKFYAAKPDGTIKWSFAAEKEIDSSAAIGAEGTIYFGSNSGIFYALNPDGTEKWHYDTKSSIASSPAIGSDGTVYVGAWDNKLYAFGGSSAEKELAEQTDKIVITTITLLLIIASMINLIKKRSKRI